MFLFFKKMTIKYIAIFSDCLVFRAFIVWVLMTFGCVFCGHLYGQDSAAWAATLSEANGLFAQKRYVEALEKYRHLEGLGLESAALYGCMGNAYMATDSTTAAILYYERALLLSPANTDLRHNLAVANHNLPERLAVVPVFFWVRAWHQMASLFRANSWAVLSLLVVWAAAIATLFFMYRRGDRFRKWYFWAAATLLLLGLLMTLLGSSRLGIEKVGARGVLLPRHVSVKDDALSGAAELIQAPGGTVVQVIESNNGWVKIRLPDGNEGWIGALDMAII